MTDYASMTDDQLKAAYAASQSPAASIDYSKMSDDELKNAYASSTSAPSTTVDVAKSGGTGLIKGALAGLGSVGDVTDLGAKGIEKASNYISGKLGIEPYQRPAAPSVLNNIPTSQSLQTNLESQTGPLYTPKTGAGKYAQTAGEFAGNPLSYVGPGGMIGKGLTALGGGLGSEAAGQYTKGSQYEPAARLLGAIAGGHAISAAPRAITPNIIAPEQQALLNTLGREGITDLTAGQKIASKPLQYTESVMADQPFAGRSAEDINKSAAGQFTQAALSRVGEDATAATPQVIDRAFKRIGDRFDELSSRNTMHLDQPVQDDLLNTAISYHENTNPLARSPVVENTMNDLAQWAGKQGGALTGEQYQNLRSRLSAASRGSNDPQLSHALSEMSESLDDAMERSIAARNPDDAGQFGDARRQYRNMLVIERAATSGGAQNVGTGVITPAALSTAAKTVLGRRSFARGQDEFSELAHAGSAAMTPLPQSGTGPRMNIIHHLQLAGLFGGADAATGAGAGHIAGSAIAGLAVPAVAGRAMMSRPVQSYLANQALPYRTGSSPTMVALMNAIRGTQ